MRRSRPGNRADDRAGDRWLTVRGAQTHGQRSIPMLPERMAAGEIEAAHLAPPSLPPDRAPTAYDLCRHRAGRCVRAVIRPESRGAA
ncbi:hypothetical protein [Streptomyces sp. NEAU-W12]|uniref:hypothetical protein n=1 Tax=Streptomyces sp. NEAU-W12 TaxID=2994668 RepID=UPI00224B2098|nr:hypothetical protein [Streptomyces sp. NEAU-W12]MCX2927312.1 hypothetical protein [Streptomyces sp. NEAU-W12]